MSFEPDLLISKFVSGDYAEGAELTYLPSFMSNIFSFLSYPVDTKCKSSCKSTIPVTAASWTVQQNLDFQVTGSQAIILEQPTSEPDIKRF